MDRPAVSPDHDELHGYYFDDLSVGMTAIYAKTMTNADIVMFAGISGDTNPIHLNEEFSGGTGLEGRVAHGMLTASLISTVIGTKLPGPGCIYLKQSLDFKAPVKAGDTVTARVTIREIVAGRKRVILDTVCRIGEKVVLDGEAVVMVPCKEG